MFATEGTALTGAVKSVRWGWGWSEQDVGRSTSGGKAEAAPAASMAEHDASTPPPFTVPLHLLKMTKLQKAVEKEQEAARDTAAKAAMAKAAEAAAKAMAALPPEPSPPRDAAARAGSGR